MNVFKYEVKEWMEGVVRQMHKRETLVSVVQWVHRPFQRIFQFKRHIDNTIKRLPNCTKT